MITCKEDLFGKYIPITSKKEADHVKCVCESFGINAADWPRTEYDSGTRFALVGYESRSGAGGVLLFSGDHDSEEDTIREFCNLSRLELTELSPSIETLQSELDKSQLKVMELTEQLAEAKGVKPPRTKFEYVVNRKSIFDLNYELKRGLLFARGEDTYHKIHTPAQLCDEWNNAPIYRRTEVEIDWREEVESTFGSIEFHESYNSVSFHCSAWDQGKYVKMCHLVAELTDKPE